MAELLPCPFCGGKAKVSRCLSNHKKFRLTHTCLDRTPHIEFYYYYFETRQEAIDFWNTRTPKKTIKISSWLTEGMTEEQIQKAKAEAIMQAEKELAHVKKKERGKK